MKRPSFQWYPNDWLSAPDVRACSIAARGLWIDMICMMHQGTPYGHLTINGKVYLEGTLAKISGISENEDKAALEELESLGVFSRTPEGVIYCRRMVADEKLRQVRAAGGFKALENPSVPKPKLDQQGIPSSYTSEEEDIPIPSSSSSSSSSSSKNTTAARAKSPAQKPRKPTSCDEEYLEELQRNPAYSHLNVKALYHRMVAWCEARPPKQPTRLRFIAWLNREDPPPQDAPPARAANDEWANKPLAEKVEDLDATYRHICRDATDQQVANVITNYNRRIREARGEVTA